MSKKNVKRRSKIDVRAARGAVLGILQSRGEHRGGGLGGCRACLLHMFSDHGDRIPVRHALPAELDMIEQDGREPGSDSR